MVTLCSAAFTQAVTYNASSACRRPPISLPAAVYRCFWAYQSLSSLLSRLYTSVWRSLVRSAIVVHRERERERERESLVLCTRSCRPVKRRRVAQTLLLCIISHTRFQSRQYGKQGERRPTCCWTLGAPNFIPLTWTVRYNVNCDRDYIAVD